MASYAMEIVQGPMWNRRKIWCGSFVDPQLRRNRAILVTWIISMLNPKLASTILATESLLDY